MEISSEFIEKAKNIRFFFTDVDGTLTDGTSYYSAEGEQLKEFSLRDGTGFYLLRKADIVAGIITGENSPIVEARAKKLKLQYCFLNTENKRNLINSFCVENNISSQQIAYIGDDLNDICLAGYVGLFFCPADSSQYTIAKADYVCTHVGGHGAFREAAEVLLRAKGLDIETLFNK